MKNIVLFGRDHRALAVREALLAAGHNILWWYSVPDRDRDWEKALSASGREISLGVVANWPLKLRPEVLAIPKYGWINCHAGPVPTYRGGSPLNWQIINGETHMGLSLLQLDEGLDTGPVISRTWFRLEKHQTIADAHILANEWFGEAVAACVTTLDRWPESHQSIPQDAYSGLGEPRTWPQRNDDMGGIDLSWPAEKVVNFVRALTHPYPGAWLKAHDGKRVRIWNASLR